MRPLRALVVESPAALSYGGKGRSGFSLGGIGVAGDLEHEAGGSDALARLSQLSSKAQRARALALGRRPWLQRARRPRPTETATARHAERGLLLLRLRVRAAADLGAQDLPLPDPKWAVARSRWATSTRKRRRRRPGTCCESTVASEASLRHADSLSHYCLMQGASQNPPSHLILQTDWHPQNLSPLTCTGLPK